MLQKVNVICDIGLISENFNQTQINQNNQYLVDLSMNSGNNYSNLIEFFAKSSNLVTTVNRYYLKIQDVIPIITSIINTLIIIIKILLSRLIDNNYYQEILDNIINYKTLQLENINLENVIRIKFKKRVKVTDENKFHAASNEIRLKSNIEDCVAKLDPIEDFKV